ncbi:pentatricopeptide repeat-containing protein 2, mitochondrial-like isoform X2 [Uloborus diversus]|uniref:pentatricopeptide repeat-containing protein 2, mitochondrial-like isoform X2 n=1 Tax=Uloborus diversus TaxID=327109 RepID=UPI00240906E5|nr:pentatricopeptide repeat-containing protein 2, mitochondrial-like isoform X2 [Uloborus diversus]
MNSLRRCVTSNTLLSRVFQEKRNVRFLYNEQFLGIDKYAEARQRTISRIGNMRDNFYNRMKAQLNSSVPSMIFTEDLKTVVHSCEDKPEEMELCIQMMKRFHKQNKELRFGTFIFGPVAMRLFYYLKKKEIILNFFSDPDLDGFFDQLKSYLLAMDLYFKNEMFPEIVEAFKSMQAKQLAETKFPREAMVLATGACYKMNTPETYQFATDLVTQAREARVPIIRKALTFVIALALKQNRPDVALEILSSIDRFNNITGNNLKLMCFAGLDRVQDAFDILRRATDQDAPLQTRIRGEICQTSLDALQKSVDKINDKETSHIFEQLCRSLKESNSITSQTIDELVCLPIEPRQFLRENAFQSRPRNRFPEQSFRMRERGGLRP